MQHLIYFPPKGQRFYFINHFFMPTHKRFVLPNFKVSYPNALVGLLCFHLHVSSIIMVTIPSSNIAQPSPNFAIS
jgi:hypothetical protein